MSDCIYTEAEMAAGVPHIINGYYVEELGETLDRFEYKKYKEAQDAKRRMEQEEIENAQFEEERTLQFVEKYSDYFFLDSLNLESDNKRIRDLFLSRIFSINLSTLIKKYTVQEKIPKTIALTALDEELLIKMTSKMYKRICEFTRRDVKITNIRRLEIECNLTSIVKRLLASYKFPYEMTNVIQKFLHEKLDEDVETIYLSEPGNWHMKILLSSFRLFFLTSQLRRGLGDRVAEQLEFIESYNEKPERYNLDDLVLYDFKPDNKIIVPDWRRKHLEGIWKYLRVADRKSFISILKLPLEMNNHLYLAKCFEYTEIIPEISKYNDLYEYRLSLDKTSTIYEAFCGVD